MLKRFLESTAANPTEFDQADFQYLIRSANEQGLLRGAWPQWRLFRELRGWTSHSYHEKVAVAVVQEIPGFLSEAEYLLAQLRARSAA